MNAPRLLLHVFMLAWPVSCCFHVLPCPRRIQVRMQEDVCLGTDTKVSRWAERTVYCGCREQKGRAAGLWQRPQASTPSDILRLPFLMLNKSFRIQGFQKKRSEDSKSAQLFLWNWTGEEFQPPHVFSPLVISNWGNTLTTSSLNILVLMDPLVLFSLS